MKKIRFSINQQLSILKNKENKNKETSLQDIAKKLGVSVTLVSLVLNGKAKRSRISDKVADKVVALAKELNYRPNQLARGLRTGKTNTLAFVMADISNIFFARMARVMEDEAEKHGYKVMFGSSDESPVKLEKMLNIFLERKVEGFIISPTQGSLDFIKHLKRMNIPFVLIDRYYRKFETNYVVVDNYDASFKAVSHLTKLGYNKIGTLSIFPELTQMNDRFKGYKDALRVAGLRFENKYVGHVDFDNFRESVFENVKRLLMPPTNVRALFFPTCIMGIVGLECIREMKFRVPLDVAVASFDDPAEYKLFETPVTAIKQPVEEIGLTAVNILIDELKNKNQAYQKVVLPTEFIVRRSCGNLEFS